MPTAGSKGKVDCKDNEEVNFKQGRATEKTKAFKSKMTTINDALEEVEIEVEEIEASAKKIAQAMRQTATAPWC